MKKICPICNNAMETTNSRKKYCKPDCAARAKERQVRESPPGKMLTRQRQILDAMLKAPNREWSAQDISDEIGAEVKSLAGIGISMKGLCTRGYARITVRSDGQRQKTKYKIITGDIKIV